MQNRFTPFRIEEVLGDTTKVISPERQLNLLNMQVGRLCTKCNQKVDLVVDGDAIRAQCEDQRDDGCGWVYWNSPMPVAAALAVVPSNYSNTTNFNGIPNYEPMTCDHLVLVKRREDPFKGEWALPAGFVNPLETPTVAAVRELAEETSLQGKAVGKLGFCCPVPGFTNVVINFSLVQITGGTMQAMDDAEEVKVFSISDMPTLPMSSHASTVELFGRKKQSYEKLLDLLARGAMSKEEFLQLKATHWS